MTSRVKEKLHSAVTAASGTPTLTVCLVYCAADHQHVVDWELPAEVQDTVQLSHANIDGGDYDEIARTIESASLVIICVSVSFVALPAAFTSIIYSTRSLRKDVCYFLARGTYVDLVHSPIYIQSTVSLLIANEFIYSNWVVLCEARVKSLCSGWFPALTRQTELTLF
jgi:hypothetical protein